MTSETRQAIQYVAMALFVLFTVAILTVFVYGYIHGTPADGTILAYVGAIMGTITAILGVNSGANTAQSATNQANANTAAVVTAANGTAGAVAKAHLGLPDPPTEAVSQPIGEDGP